MKIALTGGGTGGHFYPLIAVAEEIEKIARQKRLISPSIYYIGNKKYDKISLDKLGIDFLYCPAGKQKITKTFLSNVLNFFDMFKVLFGIFYALIALYKLYPDVVFSKGGYVAYPVCVAARFLKIPLIIHDSDSMPGRVTLRTAKSAMYIGIAFPEAEKYFSKKELEKTSLIGIPIRAELTKNANHKESGDGVKIPFKLHKNKKIILVLGGSLGASYVNDNIIDALGKLLVNFQIVHQTGKKNFEKIQKEAKIYLTNHEHIQDYHPKPFLNTYELKQMYSMADIVITRAGASTLSEISHWGIPSIIIPIPENVSRDQRSNAYAYARISGGVVIEQKNLSPGILLSQINSILLDDKLLNEKRKSALNFDKPEAAKIIANTLISILISHEK